MLNEARGLDYFLLPSLFSDCLAPGGYDTLVTERDEWFIFNPKIGKGYIDALKKMQDAGVPLLPDIGLSPSSENLKNRSEEK